MWREQIGKKTHKHYIAERKRKERMSFSDNTRDIRNRKIK